MPSPAQGRATGRPRAAFVRFQPASKPNAPSPTDFLQEIGQNSAPAAAGFCAPTYLARLAWRWHRVHFSADDTAFDFAGFAAAAGRHPERIRFPLSRSLGLTHSSYPALEIWRRNREGDDTRTLGALDEPQHLCIWRPELEPRPAVIDADCPQLLQQCGAGLAGTEAAAAERLPELISQGWTCGVTG